MNKVDQFLARAQDLATGGAQVGVCIIFQDPDSGKVHAQIGMWDGIPGSGAGGKGIIHKDFDTLQAARDYIEHLAATHPPKRGHAPIGKRVIEICPRDPAIIIDDIPSE